MNTTLNNNIIGWKVLAKVEINGKICTKNCGNLQIEGNSMFQGILRWMYGDSRQNTIAQLHNLFQTAVELSSELKSHIELADTDAPSEMSAFDIERYNQNLFDLRTLCKEMTNGVKGIDNLAKTYSGDATSSAELEVIIKNINNHIDKYNKYLSGKTELNAY